MASIGFIVQYQANRAVSVGVDIRTGRILFDHRGDVGHVIFGKRNTVAFHSLSNTIISQAKGNGK